MSEIHYRPACRELGEKEGMLAETALTRMQKRLTE